MSCYPLWFPATQRLYCARECNFPHINCLVLFKSICRSLSIDVLSFIYLLCDSFWVMRVYIYALQLSKYFFFFVNCRLLSDIWWTDWDWYLSCCESASCYKSLRRSSLPLVHNEESQASCNKCLCTCSDGQLYCLIPMFVILYATMWKMPLVSNCLGSMCPCDENVNN